MTSRERLIREIAYDLWEQEGRPEGHSERLWLAAEARFETEFAERRDERSEPPAAAVETPPRPTKRKADAAAEKLARSVKPKVAEPAPEKAPEKEARSAKRGVREDALACVEMAIAMRKKMVELQAECRESGIEKPLQCRMGINTGYCTVGNFGSEDRMDYTIIGGGVNLASRLEAAATPGEILTSYETYANIRHQIHCEARGHISVKGIAYPVATYQVVGTYETLGGQRQVIHEERPNLRLELDLEAMSADDRSQAATVLREALNRLSALDRAATPATGDKRKGT